MSISIAQAALEATQALRRAGVPEARREAASLLAHSTGRDRTFLITHGEDDLPQGEIDRFRDYVARRASGEPQQYITGRQEFFGLDFEVTPDVLIPRPETELLVETALELLGDTDAPYCICDVGTGSGCIAVAFLRHRPRARAIGLDISPAALRVASSNAMRHGVGDRFLPAVSDCFAALDADVARFCAIVSNPPYVAVADLPALQREVRDHEPRIALTPGGDGLSIIRRLLAEAPAYLIGGGHLLIEIGFDQHEAVRRLIDPRVWELRDIRRDLQGIPRTVVVKKR